MNVAVIYIYPQVQVGKYFPLAKRFAETWKQNPPGASPHTLHVIGNGGIIPPIERVPFDGIPCEFRAYSNIGWDIGAYQWAAETIPCDLLVCLGAPAHFHHPGWLDRMVEAYVTNGPALYGCWAYLSPNWHVRTTVFWIPPAILKGYPNNVGGSRSMRYEFEHGANSLTRYAIRCGFECIMVTMKGCFPFNQWEANAPGVEESLILDQHTHR